VLAPLELAGARQPEHSGERNSPNFHPTQPKRCGELTWVLLERRGGGGTETQHAMARLKLWLWATAGGGSKDRTSSGTDQTGAV
jgi:hypothetical protein